MRVQYIVQSFRNIFSLEHLISANQLRPLNAPFVISQVISRTKSTISSSRYCGGKRWSIVLCASISLFVVFHASASLGASKDCQKSLAGFKKLKSDYNNLKKKRESQKKTDVSIPLPFSVVSAVSCDNVEKKYDSLYKKYKDLADQFEKEKDRLVAKKRAAGEKKRKELAKKKDQQRVADEKKHKELAKKKDQQRVADEKKHKEFAAKMAEKRKKALERSDKFLADNDTNKSPQDRLNEALTHIEKLRNLVKSGGFQALPSSLEIKHNDLPMPQFPTTSSDKTGECKCPCP